MQADILSGSEVWSLICVGTKVNIDDVSRNGGGGISSMKNDNIGFVFHENLPPSIGNVSVFHVFLTCRNQIKPFVFQH